MWTVIKYFLAVGIVVFTATSQSQNITKYKDDFGLICPNNSPSTPVFLYSPKNKVLSVGYRQSTPFKREGTIETRGFVMTNDKIIFTTKEGPMTVKNEMGRSDLIMFRNSEGSYTTYNSEGRPVTKTLNSSNTLYCKLMSDEDFIQTIKYALTQNP